MSDMDEEWSQLKVTNQESLDEIRAYMKDLERRLQQVNDSAGDTSAKFSVLSWRVSDLENAATVPTATDPRPPPGPHEGAKDSESVENYFRQEASQARADDYHFAQQNARHSQRPAPRPPQRPNVRTPLATQAPPQGEPPLDDIEQEVLTLLMSQCNYVPRNGCLLGPYRFARELSKTLQQARLKGP